MDPATHALITFTIVRGIFPRRPWWFVLGVVFAGTIADLDLLSALFGPGAYLSAGHAVTHSILGTLTVILAVGVLYYILRPENGPFRKPTRDPENAPQKAGPSNAGIAMLLIAATLAAGLHVLLDICTSAGVALLWPWRETRFAWDWLPDIDPWILALPLAGILLPELFRLVSSEIGAKDKAPRGRNGAIAALVLVLIYVGARATLHENAVAQVDAHTYRGELPRRFAAVADSVSLVTWYGVVDTATQICTVNVPALESSRFDPESAACVHKPENSPQLQAAEQTEATKKFLQVARFPKASVGATEDGTEVTIRDTQNFTEGGTPLVVAVRVLLDKQGHVTSQRLVWASEVRLR